MSAALAASSPLRTSMEHREVRGVSCCVIYHKVGEVSGIGGQGEVSFDRLRANNSIPDIDVQDG